MQPILLMQIDSAEHGFLADYWPVLVPVLLGFVAIYALLPRARWTAPMWGVMLGGAALVLGCLLLLHAAAHWQETVLFYVFAFLAVLAGGLMVTQSNPVYAALSFALVVLSTCGLFLLQAAPFLMAATIIIYAGAIVVTFLFVIMLAQQEGYSTADLLSREPFLGALAGFALMGATMCSVQRALQTPVLDRAIAQVQQLTKATSLQEADSVLGTGQGPITALDEAMTRFDLADPVFEQLRGIKTARGDKNLDALKGHAIQMLARLEEVRGAQGSLAAGPVPEGQARIPGHPSLQPGKLPHRNVEGLGRLLFTTYLVPVELAGVILLVASIGAIVIAGRHTEVLR